MYAGGPGGDPLNYGWGGSMGQIPSGLMGNVARNPMAGLMGSPQFATQQQTMQGPWSQLAYQMAGRPNQGPYANVAVPQGVSDASAASSSGVGALGGTALGLLGTLANNPSAAKSMGNLGSTAVSKIGGLLGGGGVDTAAIGSAANAAAAGMGSSIAPGVSAGLANTAGDVSASNAAWLAAQPAAGAAAPVAGSLGAIMAGGDAAMAPVGVGAIDVLPSVTSAANAGAAGGTVATSGAAGGAAAGSLIGGLAGVGIALAPALYGMSKPAVELTGQYWNGYSKILQNGPSDPNYKGAVLEALNMPQNEVPQNIQRMVLQSGMTVPGRWGQPAAPNNVQYGATGRGGNLSSRV